MPVPFRGSPGFIVSLLLVFLALSVADLGLTWLLIEGKGASAIESNPLAASVLERHGWTGLTLFKLTLMAVISGLAIAVMCYRQRTAELLLVFGCGTQAAVVLTSAFLCRSVEANPIDPAPVAECAADMPGISGNASYLMLQQSVQEELGLSESQIEQVRQIASARREIRFGTRNWALDQLRESLAILEGQERMVLSELTPGQSKRLQQLAWQAQGPLAMIDPEVIRLLQLDGTQLRAIYTVVGDSTISAVPLPSRGATRESDRIAEGQVLRNQLWSMLDANQQAKWREAIGEPFRFGSRSGNVVLAE